MFNCPATGQLSLLDTPGCLLNRLLILTVCPATTGIPISPIIAILLIVTDLNTSSSALSPLLGRSKKRFVHVVVALLFLFALKQLTENTSEIS